MRRSVSLCLALLLGSAVAFASPQDRKYSPWKLYNKGVRWQKTLEDAKKLAKKEGKLVLYYLNTGDIDKFETS